MALHLTMERILLYGALGLQAFGAIGFEPGAAPVVPMQRRKSTMLTRTGFLSSMVTAGGLLLAQGAMAQSAPTALERDILAMLTPTLRAEVEGRMQQPNQRVYEILETIILNKIQMAYAARRIVSTDYIRGVVVVEGSDGTMRTFLLEVPTLTPRAS